MFKKNEVIFYPFHGRAQINRVVKESNGLEYYELLYGKNLTVLIPTERSELLGMRYPMGKNKLLQLLKDSKQMKINDEDFLHLSKIVSSRLASGDIQDLIYIIKLIRALSVTKKEKNKKLEMTERQYLAQAKELLYAETDYVLGQGSIKKFSL